MLYRNMLFTLMQYIDIFSNKVKGVILGSAKAVSFHLIHELPFDGTFLSTLVGYLYIIIWIFLLSYVIIYTEIKTHTLFSISRLYA